ncbi:M24 family metallopeptidase [Spiroplasma eriocheiris]|uniref:Xaa-Pro dipeptidase n=1 Tax=Spiroplasma eriocheiris TaxID=315358 RepID=A0A0H3XMY5_9MOLU|nr:Xaa-Pro peptidase family protein [Spiroplasma eriocheiris]AHF58010.1 putative Xaa-Pro dipeptidase [Spiroplasma eriocheiris CCTCC M 207170]AKM54452.1 Xaa-Pro dipeptidase [Spiroplasma eriocheiris]
MKNKIVTDLLVSNDLDAILITSKVNRYWYTNFPSSSGYLLITRTKAFLLLDGRYLTDAKTKVQNAEIIAIKDIFKDLKTLITAAEIKKLGFENEYLTYDFYLMYQENLGMSLIPTSVRQLRMVKTPEEINLLQHSAWITDQALQQVIDNFDVGMSEDDIENIIFTTFAKLGADKIYPRAIVTSGVRGSLPHGKPTTKPIMQGELVTIDFGCVYQGYYSDMTRTLAVGEISSQLQEIYEVVQTAQRLGVQAIAPGVKASDIHRICYDYINQKGYGEYFVHQTGHGVGLEVHEAPRIATYDNTPLQAGMVVTVDPGIYLPNVGGVRIEDDILVTTNGFEYLTKHSHALINLLKR